MQVWIDADACPKMVKEILFRAAVRTKITFTFIANQSHVIPPSPFIKKIVVAAGFDVADTKILESMEKGDLVITADILLADAVVEKGGTALDPRGRLYTPQNIKQTLSMRNFNSELRDAGQLVGGPGPLSKKEIQLFANSLDAFLTSHNK